MYMGIYSWNGAFTEKQLGIMMYYDDNNVWWWGLLKDVYGNSFIKLEKIVNGVGYSNQWYVSSTATWWGLEWYNNQVRWSYYDGSWHNGPGFYSLEYTPGYIGTFYKEWAGWSEPDRYCYFGYMVTGISNGS